MVLDALSPSTSFAIGLLASVSTCLVVIGGLVLSLSAKLAQDRAANVRVFLLFHIGRLFGFFLLGGALGALGGMLSINQTIVASLNALVGAVMFLLGLNLVGMLKGKSLKFSPRVFEFFTALEHSRVAPLALGVGTFFFPCGFTQSVQVAALASGSFWSGALLMGAFALGTLPMLLVLSFGVTVFGEGGWRTVFFKIAGVVVLCLSFLTLWASASSLGWVQPLAWNVGSRTEQRGVPVINGVQQVVIDAKTGYSPQTVLLKADMPVELVVHTSSTYDCSAGLVIPKLGYKKFLKPNGDEVVSIASQPAGETLEGHCVMGMYSFQLVFE